ncbi:thermonuclease family protein (plasmid) [Escherichia coli]
MMKYIPLVLFIFSWPVLSADIHGRVVRVLDGDTIEVMDSQKAVRIRLVNIDAPEKKQDYGRWSTDMMKSLVAGKTVTVTYFQRDRYGRILGQVYAPDGMNINQFMVRAGAAWVYEQYNSDPVLPVLQNEARRHCCKVSDEAAFCLIQRPYISKTLLTRRISPRGSP